MTSRFIPRGFPRFTSGTTESEAFKTEVYLENLQRKLTVLENTTKLTPLELSNKQYVEKQIKRMFHKLNNLWRSVYRK
jgi:hypothetical protein